MRYLSNDTEAHGHDGVVQHARHSSSTHNSIISNYRLIIAFQPTDFSIISSPPHIHTSSKSYTQSLQGFQKPCNCSCTKQAFSRAFLQVLLGPLFIHLDLFWSPVFRASPRPVAALRVRILARHSVRTSSSIPRAGSNIGRNLHSICLRWDVSWYWRVLLSCNRRIRIRLRHR